MKNFIVIFCLTLLINLSIQASTPASKTYIAAVVEFDVKTSELFNKEKVERRAKQYAELIETDTESTQDFDIIVFPESTLNSPSMAIEIPDQNDKIVPCENNTYEKYFQDISCAAKLSKRYVAINLSTKINCTLEKYETNDDRPCSNDGWNLYNTNVVFDRNGTVISTYRKFNLFETDVNSTLKPDFGIFTTDFDVTFGSVICFDLVLRTPVLDLINEKGIKNIIFPTMWFSEMPFLTAAQYQQNWAHRLNVNLLAAGASNPSVGSTGSGIYSGQSGPKISVMSSIAQTRLLVAEIPKIPSTVPPAITSMRSSQNATVTDILKSDESIFPNEVLPIKMKLDHIQDFNFMPISTNAFIGHTVFDFCQHGLCCSFFAAYRQVGYPANVLVGTKEYSYVAAITNSRRSFGGFANGGIQMCAIIACTNGSDYSTCGSQFPVGTKVLNRFDLTSLSVRGTFTSDNINTMPTSLTMGLMPMHPAEFNFTVGEPYQKNRARLQDISIQSLTSKGNLLTFGIYARDFAQDNSATGIKSQFLLMLLPSIYIFSVIFK